VLAKAVLSIEDADWRSWCSVAFRLLCLAGFAGPEDRLRASDTTDEGELVSAIAGEDEG
jgi:hypothetical protein